MHAVAAAVCEQLHFDVARPVQEALDEHGRVAERAAGLGHGALKRLLELCRVAHHTHAAATAAHRRLDDHGEAHLLDERLRGLVALDRTRRARHDRHVCGTRQVARLGLVTERVDRLGTGTDERDPGILHRTGKLRVLREEAVARVDHVHAALLGNPDDVVNRQVRGHRAQAGAHLVRLVHLEAVRRVPVLEAVNSDRVHTQLVSRTANTDGNFLRGQHGRLHVLGYALRDWRLGASCRQDPCRRRARHGRPRP